MGAGMSRALALAVLARALEDAQGRMPDQNGAPGKQKKVQEEALLFWTSDDPEWRHAREVWCGEAGFDVDYASEQARKIIAGSGASLRGSRPNPELNARRYAAVKALRAKGIQQQDIAQRLGISTDTVRIWERRGEAQA